MDTLIALLRLHRYTCPAALAIALLAWGPGLWAGLTTWPPYGRDALMVAIIITLLAVGSALSIESKGKK